MKTFKKIDYKDKYFIITDLNYEDEYGMDFEVGQITLDEITDEWLKGHCEATLYYGIPSYIGKDAELNKRVKRMEKIVAKEDEARPDKKTMSSKIG